MTDETQAPAAEGQAPAPEAQGQAAKPWYTGYDDETVGYIQNKGWDDPKKAIDAYKNLEKFRGVPEDQLLKLPKDLSEEGALDPIYAKLGRPESPDKYELKLPEQVPIDEARVAMAKEVAHKLGLNGKQLQALIDADTSYYANAVAEMQKEREIKAEAELNDLKKSWGNAFEERAEIARRFIRHNAPEGIDRDAMFDALESAVGLKATLEFFAKAGESSHVTEGRVPDASSARPFGYTPQQAAADRRALMQDVQADPKRLDLYNQGKGADYEKMMNLNRISQGG